jgi:hypothetical protein
MSTTQQPIDDGGRAFPSTNRLGMTYRQWLAGMAMQGLVSNPDVSMNSLVALARATFDIADAMIAEQKKDMIIDRGEGR